MSVGGSAIEKKVINKERERRHSGKEDGVYAYTCDGVRIFVAY